MPQNEHIEQAQKRYGKRLDHAERLRKREARRAHTVAHTLKHTRGMKAKLAHKARYAEKAEIRKKIREHEEKQTTERVKEKGPKNALPSFLMDRTEADRAKVLSNSLKQKRKEKAGKWAVPIEKVKPVSEDEMLKAVVSGKRGKKSWKRLVNKVTFVGETFTRKMPKMERFIRPMALRFKKAHVTHPELKATFHLPIISVKKNPQGKMYTGLGVITKGSVIEVNVSELGLVTPSGKVVWGKYAQVTNNPENDGCINAVLLV
ncbi:ribosome biogenesis protein NSA2 [Angomonas deanei]|uniref:Ribosome biogenesis protein NSA2 homolog n=1 Tax=Angomonas deanei TaxID=59799 RepID=A0A7G2C3E7_9TRYP|nr:ribosome biogenesis protein NSA2 [Angomonas deanei]CAD2213263.1 Ribosomal protein S8e, putative [Angomonas deanei]|eukprot:EPY39997.1 ribosome biogenesis protein NSA2 [Angomonas deanei]